MKIRNTISTIALGSAMAVLMQVQTAQASFASLGSLLGGGTLVNGDKTFSNFGFTTSGFTTDSSGNVTAVNSALATSLAIQAGALTVTAFNVGAIYYLDFAGSITVGSTSSTSYLLGDLKLSYTVSVNSGPAVIDYIDQQYSPNGLPNPGNQIIIGETAVGTTDAANSTLTLNPNDIADPAPEAGDNLYFHPGQTNVVVVKDILISAAITNQVGLSDVQQSFHQAVVPEPTTVIAGALLLLPFGVSTLRIMRKNRTS